VSFDPAWLALREPADHAARDPGLLAALGRALGDRSPVEVIDLGCGTGSNLRAVAPHLGPEQSWRLVDHDPALLAAARATLADWADTAVPDGGALRLEVGERRLRVRFVEADLAGSCDAVIRGSEDHGVTGSPDLVTAAALFDLVSAAWIERFVRALPRGAAFYTALTYDGRESWTPAHPADAAIHAAFLAHQRRDKGFGPSAGPKAATLLRRALDGTGRRVQGADSPWRLPPGPLAAALAQGIADAVRETGLVEAAEVEAWQTARAGAACTIGHRDLLALPHPEQERGRLSA
jgi:SAM-dependent methyltransferase